MIDDLYRKCGSYFKNRSWVERQACSLSRKIFLGWHYINRKVLAIRYSGKPSLVIPEDIGYLRVDGLETFDHVEEVIALARKSVAKLDTENLDWRDKPHLYTKVLAESPPADSPLVKFALQKTVIDTVSQYFGYIPVLAYMGIWVSPRETETLTNSQLFHCDQADVRQMKVFLHCSDVSERDGPLHVITARESRRMQRAVHYCWSDEQQCLPDSVVSRHVPMHQWSAATGSAGTVLFGDTSRCFHFGSRVAKDAQPRVMAVFQFLSPFAFTLPRRFKQGLPGVRFETGQYSNSQRAVLGLA